MMQIGLAQTPGHMLVTNMFAPRWLDPPTPVHPASSLCQESSFQLKFDYWFLILVPFFMLMALWILILLNIRAFSSIDVRAGDLLLPYLLWVTFALYLNLGVFLLN